MLEQQGAMDNPFATDFGSFASQGDVKAEETISTMVSEHTISVNAMLNHLKEVDSMKIANEVAKRVSLFTDFIADAALGVMRALAQIARQAVKMAAFKFAIEMCAMAIKSMVESMLKMSLTPPNIDTKGVFYNITGANTTTAPMQAPSSGSRYDNPFSNPFGNMPQGTW